MASLNQTISQIISSANINVTTYRPTQISVVEEDNRATLFSITQIPPHPLYYVIAILLFLILLVCCCLFVWVYHSHKKTQKLIENQQAQINNKSLNFFQSQLNIPQSQFHHHGQFGHSVPCKSPTSMDAYMHNHNDSTNILMPPLQSPKSVNSPSAGLRLYRIQDSNKKITEITNEIMQSNNNNQQSNEESKSSETSVRHSSEESEPKVSDIKDLSNPTTSTSADPDQAQQSSESNKEKKVKQTAMPPPPKRKKNKNKNKYRHVQNNSHSIILQCHSPHSVMSISGQNVIGKGWNYDNYRAAFHGYNNSVNKELAYRDVQNKLKLHQKDHENEYSADQFDDDLDVMKGTVTTLGSGETEDDEFVSMHAVNGTVSTGIALSLHGDDSLNYNMGMSLPSSASAIAPQSRLNKKGVLASNVVSSNSFKANSKALVEGNESDNDNDDDDEGVDLERVKNEINELMNGDNEMETNGNNNIGYEDESEEEDLEIDLGDEKNSYVKKFDALDGDEEFPDFKGKHQRANTASTIIEDTYLNYLE